MRSISEGEIDSESSRIFSLEVLYRRQLEANHGANKGIARLRRKIAKLEAQLAASVPVSDVVKDAVCLHSTTDATIWASEFCRLNPLFDYVLAVSWFANAIECGRDHGKRSMVEQPRTLTPETKMSGADSVKKMQDLGDKILASSQPKQPDNKEPPPISGKDIAENKECMNCRFNEGQFCPFAGRCYEGEFWKPTTPDNKGAQ